MQIRIELQKTLVKILAKTEALSTITGKDLQTKIKLITEDYRYAKTMLKYLRNLTEEDSA